MSWLLDTAFNPGDADPGKTYAEIDVVVFHQTKAATAADIELCWEYGNTVDGNWVRGDAQPAAPGAQLRVIIHGDDYATLTTDTVSDVQTSDPASPLYIQVGAVWVERTYVTVKRTVYEYLVANALIPTGVVQ